MKGKKVFEKISKIPNKVLSVMIYIAVVLATYLIAKPVLNAIEIDDIKCILVTMENLSKLAIEKNMSIRKIAWAVLIIDIIGIVIVSISKRMVNKQSKKKTLKLIEHKSLNNMIISVYSKILSQYNIESLSIDLEQEMNKEQLSRMDIQYAVKKQDELIKNYLGNMSNKYQYGYTGIAHTPLIFRLGYQIGDETRFLLFHKNRNEEYFKQLEEEVGVWNINVEKEKLDDGSKELLVSIATTFEISDEQLEVFNIDEINLIKFKTSNLGFDVIQNRKQIDKYVNNIMTKIRSIVNQQKIEKIHLVISSSVAFTFALGQAISNHYDPEIIIYHYDRNNERRYPWGINIYKKVEECLVVN
ncbi:SAVED domain-containing protein [Inediibacterium massiliense]|uniref:SAVED domain-containing protein n=1 Tax=Inediibacterium massiliense TaxID=1658111 RepID=UPI0006B51467|nr:SAVED domain-containing protein [Inediibacterium massiliense]